MFVWQDLKTAVPGADRVQELRANVNSFLKMKNEDFLRRLFQMHAEETSETTRMAIGERKISKLAEAKPQNSIILADGLRRAFLELGVHMDKEKADALVMSTDSEERGGLDFEDFKRALKQPPTLVEQWICKLPLPGMLASCLPVHNCDGDKPLRDISDLSAETLDAAVEAFSGAVRLLLAEAQTRLQTIFSALDAKAAAPASEARTGDPCVCSKFSTFDFGSDDVDYCHAGLASRIGKLLCRRSRASPSST